MRARLALVGLTLLVAPAVAQAQPAPPPPGQPGPEAQRLRRELRAMEALLDQTVTQVSRPNPGFVLAGAPASRGYLLHGHGVVFVLAPRRLPMSPLAMGPANRMVVIQRFGQANDLRQLEVQVAEFQAQVQQDWQALEQSFGEVQARIWAAAPDDANPNRPRRVVDSRPVLTPGEAPMDTPPPAPPLPPDPPAAPLPALPATPPASAPDAPPPPFPAPPWTLWGAESTDEAESRAPDRVVADTREALLLALENYGHVLTTLPPDEMINVVVDFVAGTPFQDENARPARSLSLRVRKRDLDDRKAGRISAEELRGRIETTEY